MRRSRQSSEVVTVARWKDLHHGDSGAIAIPMIKNGGHIHCRAYGILYAHWSSRPIIDLMTPIPAMSNGVSQSYLATSLGE